MSSPVLVHRSALASVVATLAFSAVLSAGARAQSPPPGLPGTGTSPSAPAVTLGSAPGAPAPGSPAAAAVAEEAARIARSRAVKAPESHIPGRAMLELRELERAFDSALF